MFPLAGRSSRGSSRGKRRPLWEVGPGGSNGGPQERQRHFRQLKHREITYLGTSYYFHGNSSAAHCIAKLAFFSFILYSAHL